MAEVEQKHLAGLTYRTAEKRKIKDDNGDVKEKSFGVDRPLKLTDILAQKDTGENFVIVTRDGKKYTVPKTPEKGGKEA